jgi:hypothetical protein
MADKRLGKAPQATPDKPKDGAFGRAGMAMMIPTVMAAGPLAGWLVGHGIRLWTGWGGWIETTFFFLGLIAGARETIRIIRKLE